MILIGDSKIMVWPNQYTVSSIFNFFMHVLWVLTNLVVLSHGMYLTCFHRVLQLGVGWLGHAHDNQLPTFHYHYCLCHNNLTSSNHTYMTQQPTWGLIDYIIIMPLKISPFTLFLCTAQNNQKQYSTVYRLIRSYIGFSVAQKIRVYIEPNLDQPDPELDYVPQGDVASTTEAIEKRGILQCISGWTWCEWLNMHYRKNSNSSYMADIHVNFHWMHACMVKSTEFPTI